MTSAIGFALGLVLGAGAWHFVRSRRSSVPVSSDPDLTLHDVFEVMPPQSDLREALDAVALLVSSRLDDAPVVLRLFNPRTRLYEARAFAGLGEADVVAVSNSDVSQAQFARWAERGRPRGAGFDLRAAKTDTDADLVICSARYERLWILPLPGSGDAHLGYLALGLATRRSEPELEAVIARLTALAAPLALVVEQSVLRGELHTRTRECSLAAEELQGLQRLKDNFVATVSHELRTPLTSIKAYAEMLFQKFDTMSADQAREFSHVILRESDRLDEAFDTILDVAQPDARMRWRNDRFDLREICTKLHRGLSGSYANKGVELSLHAPSAKVALNGDRTAITQVLRNLLDNALKFTGEGGQVHLRLEPGDGQARIVVEDTGIGIPPGERERIFERFYQVDGSSTRLYGGQGLGLAICRDIIENHAGRIWAERAGEGGARFVVVLPERGLVLHPHHEDDTDAAERLQRMHFFRLATAFVAETLHTRIVSIMRTDETGQGLRIEASLGLDPGVVRDGYVHRGEGVAGLVWSEGRSILVPDLDADPRFRGRVNEIVYPTRSLLSCPLVRNGEVVGVVNVNNKAGGAPFDADDRVVLEAVAERLAQALHRFDEYCEDYRRLGASQTALRAMLSVTRQRSTPLRGLAEACGTETGRRLGLPEDELRALTYALRHYDLGLADVGSHILDKSEPLNEAERDQIRDHVRRGVELAAELEPSPGVKKILLHHHENVDGSGYPHGSQGEAIPVGARIVRLVDSFCALVDARPYRDPLPPEAAVAELERGIGREYCARVAPLFLSVLRDRHEQLDALWQRENPRTVAEPADDPIPVGVLEE